MPPSGLIALLANPEKFDGKQITVFGYLVIDRQKKHIPEAFLFLHEEDANNLLPNSVQVLPSEQMLRDAEKINGMYVMMTGVAHYKTVIVIKDVRSCKVISDPRRPIMLSGESPAPNKK
jgi:3-mercaptopyruvate sulfurtransferase SseA